MRLRPVAGTWLLVALALFFGPPVHAQDYDNTDTSSRWGTVGPFPPSIGVGQVMVTNQFNPYLNSFSFWIGGGPTIYEAYIAALTPQSFTNVWSSGPITNPNPIFVPPASAGYVNPLSLYQRVDFSVGLLLDPTIAYAAYLRPTSALSGGMSMAAADRGGVVDNRITADDFWVALDFTTNRWGAQSTLQSAFVADYCSSAAACTSVPEPGTWMLMLTGMLGLGLIARRRRMDAI